MKIDLNVMAKKYDWWWRTDPDPEFTLLPTGQTRKNKHELSLFWKDGYETAAHAYELVRRLCPEMNLPHWVKLNALQQRELKRVVGRSDISWVTSFSTKGCHELRGDPCRTLPIQFNLEASNTALRKAFEKFIAEERQRKGILGPKKRRRNSVSWRWLEVWDMHEREGQALSNAEHGMKTKAKKAAVGYKERILATLQQVETNFFSRQKPQKGQ
jgi:hypothetical protein